MKEISYKDLQINPFTLISDGWLLLTAGNQERSFNTMTVSWGHLGAIWGHGGGRPTAICYVRPQRYTKEFIDREDHFTLSAFAPEYKRALGYLGSHSGRDGDKIAEAGLTPAFVDDTTYLAEANLVLVCRKLYHGDLTEQGFVDPRIVEENYPERDFHTMYVGEIEKVLVAE